MNTSRFPDNRRLLITFACGFTGCFLTGLLFFGTTLFSFGTPRSFILVYGFTGALAFSALKYRNIRDSILLTFAAFVLNIIYYKSFPLSFVFRDAVVFSCLWISIFLYSKWLKRLADRYIFVRAFSLGTFASFTLITAGFVLILVNVPFFSITSRLITNAVFFFLQTGMVTGLGLGLGFDAADILMELKKKKESIGTN